MWFRAIRANALDPNVIVVADLANDTGDSTLAKFGTLAGDFISARIGEAGLLHSSLTQPDATLLQIGRALVAVLRRRHVPPESQLPLPRAGVSFPSRQPTLSWASACWQLASRRRRRA